VTFGLSSPLTLVKSPVTVATSSLLLPAGPPVPTFSFSSSSKSLPASRTTATPPSIATATTSSPSLSSLSRSKPFSFSTRVATTSSSIPPLKVSYSYAQFEEERRKKIEEEKAKRAEGSESVLRALEGRQREAEEQRKREQEKKNEEMEKRKQEDEARKQKAREMSEAREQRILEERKKREAVLMALKQKPTHNLIIANFFQKVDEEEIARKMEEELKEYSKQVEETKAKEETKERSAQEKIAQRIQEKEKKRMETEAQALLESERKATEKIQRREDYVREKELDDARKKKEWQERQERLLREFLEREKKRQLKKQQGARALVAAPDPTSDTDKRKIFIGGIELDDIAKANLDPKLSAKVRDERINSILRMFEQFGEIQKRKVVHEHGHCFITFKNPESVQLAMDGMKAEDRKKLVEEATRKLTQAKQHPLCAPHATFYVRVPKTKTKILKAAEANPAKPSPFSGTIAKPSSSPGTTAKPSSPRTDRPLWGQSVPQIAKSPAFHKKSERSREEPSDKIRPTGPRTNVEKRDRPVRPSLHNGETDTNNQNKNPAQPNFRTTKLSHTNIAAHPSPTVKSSRPNQRTIVNTTAPQPRSPQNNNIAVDEGKISRSSGSTATDTRHHAKNVNLANKFSFGDKFLWKEEDISPPIETSNVYCILDDEEDMLN